MSLQHKIKGGRGYSKEHKAELEAAKPYFSKAGKWCKHCGQKWQGYSEKSFAKCCGINMQYWLNERNN